MSLCDLCAKLWARRPSFFAELMASPAFAEALEEFCNVCRDPKLSVCLRLSPFHPFHYGTVPIICSVRTLLLCALATLQYRQRNFGKLGHPEIWVSMGFNIQMNEEIGWFGGTPIWGNPHTLISWWFSCSRASQMLRSMCCRHHQGSIQREEGGMTWDPGGPVTGTVVLEKLNKYIRIISRRCGGIILTNQLVFIAWGDMGRLNQPQPTDTRIRVTRVLGLVLIIIHLGCFSPFRKCKSWKLHSA